jgi:hypothetical protein
MNDVHDAWVKGQPTGALRHPAVGTMRAMYGIMGGMEKTTVYLTTAQKTALARAAQAEGRSEAYLIRAGVDAVVAGLRAGETRAGLAEATEATAAQSAPPGRQRWIERDAFVRLLAGAQADPGLGDELRALAPETTDYEPLP